MTNRTTREQAETTLEALLIAHSSHAFFQRAEVAANGDGFGIDVWVDREEWESTKWAHYGGMPPIGSNFDGIPVCVMVVG